MPEIAVNGVTLHYEESGDGEETILFIHGLLWSTRLWDAQVAALAPDYRCIAYDLRGQGRSEVPRTSSISIETLYDDAIALIERLGPGPCHVVGLSMGGFVGLRLAIRRPALVRSLLLMATSGEPEPRENLFSYRILNLITRLGGLRLVAGRVMRILFGRTFLEDPDRQEERRYWKDQLLQNRRTIYRAVNGVLEREGVSDDLGRIEAPTLILVGEEDGATVPARAEALRDGIPGARLVRLPRGGHTLCVEQAERVNEELAAFLATV